MPTPPHSSQNIPNAQDEKLLAYLQGQLHGDEAKEIEDLFAQDEFDKEALEGLKKIKDKSQINAIVNSLNHSLKLKTKTPKKAVAIGGFNATWVVIIYIFIFLIIISFILVKLLGKEN